MTQQQDETYGEWTGAPMPGGGAGASDAPHGHKTPATGADPQEAAEAAEEAGEATPACE